MIKQWRNILHLLAAAMAFSWMAQSQAAPIDMSIVSGSTWRSTSTAAAGWTGTAFDDSAWSLAFAPYPNNVTTPDDIAGEPSNAELMWHWPGLVEPNGENGPNEAWFRYTFNLALTPSSFPLVAQALIIADDEFELFINGVLYSFGQSTALDNNLRPNGQPNPLFVDFGSMLVNGTNVLAIHAADGSLAAPRERSYEYVYFEGSIVTVPEPGSTPLILFGLLVMVCLASAKSRRP